MNKYKYIKDLSTAGLILKDYKKGWNFIYPDPLPHSEYPASWAWPLTVNHMILIHKHHINNLK